MKADLTRDTFAPQNHFRQVLAQQGRVQLDAELNEQSALHARRDETTAADLIGDCGGPADAAAFGMSAIAGQPGDFLLSPGRYYLDGIQCELEQPVSFRQQPDLPGLPALPAGTHLVYLDVWQRHLTFLDDPRLLETALGGVDTTTRVKTVWQARTLPVTGAPDCSGAYPEFTARTSPSTIRLQAQTQLVAGAGDPCQMAEGSGYKSLENQLYRVEVHSLLAADQARGVGRAAVWKWSRENASVEVSLNAVDAALKRLTVASLGRDDKLGIRKGDFVELTDDAIELAGRHGDLIEVDDVDEGDLTITLKAAPAILTTVAPARHPRVRRWEGTANVQANRWLDLEAGIQVKFADITAARPGDFWQIPARTSAPGARAGTIEWPQSVPNTPDSLLPRGTGHHYCRLGFITVSAGAPVFTDCRCLWPSLTSVPRLFYLSGDGQEVMPRAPFNKLPQPLVAGIANAHCAEGPRIVRFTVITGSGRVGLAGGAAAASNVEVPVNAAGEARCDFHLDRSTYSQQVRAELLDAGGHAVRPALTFNATLSVAGAVAYDPANCSGMKNASPPIATVQDALDFLCQRKSGVECCVTIGKLGDHPGDYETVAAALEDLLLKRQFDSICLSLLSGDHFIDNDLAVTPGDGKRATHIKIAGCSHASRLFIKAPLVFKNLAAVVIRDLVIGMDGIGVWFDGCREVEISTCHIGGRSAGSALLNIAGARRATLVGNAIRAIGEGKATAPSKLLERLPALARAYQLADEQEFAAEAVIAADDLAKLTRSARTLIAKELGAAAKEADVDLTAAERTAYTAMFRTLSAQSINAKTLAARLAAIRKLSATAAPMGRALTLLDFGAAAVLADNRITGDVTLGGPPTAKPLTDEELKRLGDLLKRGSVEFTSAAGTLQLRGNALARIAADDTSLAALRTALQAGAGAIPVWASAHFTDNIIDQGGNYFIARHLSLSTTRFLEVRSDLGVAHARTATYLGNSADNDVRLFNFSSIAPALAANQGLNIVG